MTKTLNNTALKKLMRNCLADIYSDDIALLLDCLGKQGDLAVKFKAKYELFVLVTERLIARECESSMKLQSLLRVELRGVVSRYDTAECDAVFTGALNTYLSNPTAELGKAMLKLLGSSGTMGYSTLTNAMANLDLEYAELGGFGGNIAEYKVAVKRLATELYNEAK